MAASRAARRRVFAGAWGVEHPARPADGARCLGAVAAAVVLLAVGPARATDEPRLSPGAATAIPAGLTLGLGGAAALAMTLSQDDDVVVLGTTLAIVALLTPEFGYYTTGHVARGVGMFALRVMAAGSVGYLAGIGIWAATDPCPPRSDPFCGLGIIMATALGFLASQLIFVAFEWWDTFNTVEDDWEAYRSSTAAAEEPSETTPAVAVSPTILGDASSGRRVLGLQLTLLY